MKHNTDNSTNCWCLPKVEKISDDNYLVVHREWPGWIAKILYWIWYQLYYQTKGATMPTQAEIDAAIREQKAENEKDFVTGKKP